MANSRVSQAEIVKMAEDTLRLLYAAQGLDFEAEKAKRQAPKLLTNHNVGEVGFEAEST